MGIVCIDGYSANVEIIGSLILEVTRRCNMGCLHCLRGPAQRLDMPEDTLRRALWVFEHIKPEGTEFNVTLTGGEPTLKPNAFYEVARNIKVDNIWFATNAKRITTEFLDNITFALDRGIEVSIDISEDQYHEGANDKNKLYNLDYLNGFTINVRGRINDAISQGRAKTNQIGWREPGDLIQDIVEEPGEEDEEPNFFIYTTVYVNAKGEIISGCDYSYAEQNKHIISSIFKSPEEILQDYANYHWEEMLGTMLESEYYQERVFI